MIDIYSFQFSDADFLEWQFITFKKFFQHEHRLVCINNVYDKPGNRTAIEERAKSLGIPHFYPKGVNHRKGGWSHQTALNWTWHNFIINQDQAIIVDHDVFPIKSFSCDFSYNITGIMQGRGEHIRYFHPCFMVINDLRDKDTIDFTGQVIDGHPCDTGGNWHHYIKAHPDLRVKDLNLQNISTEQGNLDVLPDIAGYNQDDPMQICDDFLIHYRNGSNWAWIKQELYDRKKQQLKTALDYYMS